MLGLASSEGLGITRVQLEIAAFRSPIDRSAYLGQRPLNPRPACGPENDNCQISSSQILLVPQVLISGDKNFVLLGLGCDDQFPVLQSRPASFVGSHDFVPDQGVAQRRRCSVIEENPQLCHGKRTASGVLQHRACLIQRHAREPVKELMDGGVILQVLKKGRDGYAGAFEDPGTTHPRGIALDSGAG